MSPGWGLLGREAGGETPFAASSSPKDPSLHQVGNPPSPLKRSILHRTLPSLRHSQVLPRPFPPLPSSSKNSSWGLLWPNSSSSMACPWHIFRESSSAGSSGQGGHAGDAGLLPPAELFPLQVKGDFIPAKEEQGERGGGSPARFRSEP